MVATRISSPHHRSPFAALAVALLSVLLVGGTTAGQGATPVALATPDPVVLALEPAVAFLATQQGDDGGILTQSGESDPGATSDAVVALKAASLRGVAVEPALGAAVAYLEREGGAYAATGPGQSAKLVLAAVAAGKNPAAFGPQRIDLLAAMTAPLAVAPPIPGLLGDDLYDHALVLLAHAAIGRPLPAAALDPLRSTQIARGGWAYDGSTDAAMADSNTTALIVQALVATGNGTDPMVAGGLEYLRSLQTILGQFAFQDAAPDEPLVADSYSTALGVQAIVATGQDPTSKEDWGNAARGLAVFQNASGAFRYQDAVPADDALATVQAIPALAGLPLPVGVACADPAPAAVIDATPVVALPAPGRSQVACVALEAA